MSSKSGFKPKKAAGGGKKPQGKGARPQATPSAQKRKRESPLSKGAVKGKGAFKGKGGGQNKKKSDEGEEGEDNTPFEEVSVEEDGTH